MLLTEQHVLKGKHWQEADQLCFASKNLFNRGLYSVRQHFFETDKFLNYNSLDKQLQKEESYRALPAKVAQGVLRQIDRGFRSFFGTLQKFNAEPHLFAGRPKIPKYKEKQKGRNCLIYSNQAISKKALEKGMIKLSKTSIQVKTKAKQVQEVRLVPKPTGEIILEVVFVRGPQDLHLNKNNRLSIDLGVNNLCAMTSDKPEFQPILVKGGAAKSINQWFNKKKAEMQSLLEEGRKSSKSIHRLIRKRNRKIKHLFHQVSKFVVESCKANDIGTIVIGRNKQWKQKLNIGKSNNQNFTALPFFQLIQQISYKAELAGIEVIEVNEAYTSKCSALDLESVEHHENYLGRRIKRGLFKTAEGILVNSDVNGSLNILRKAFPKAFADGTEAVEQNSQEWRSFVVQPKSAIFAA
ncbi:MAG: Transposase, IS605 OrfB family [Candidatus Woesebacteria bacterium GW2011_GWB1_39_12]|uniref:Transposase, IS605 OrfB family n=1 Tax=Candidatus Woesebacteria bacterium GW2011_GWB1_39_12 TaxID=1618574 RepID=A0A0G0MJK8_9BACT|nr:MAG: Transposase, IS605 OrfB family [Candidatus Woesebacteria bacterium GW2011_GWB1_39_12]